MRCSGRRERVGRTLESLVEPQHARRSARPPPGVVPLPPPPSRAPAGGAPDAGPDEIPELHSRAAAWYAANGMPEDAIEHALAAGDADRSPTLILELMSPVWASGRVETVLRWMQWLEGHPSADALCRGDGPWRAHLCAARESRRGRAVGGSGRAPPSRGRLPARRKLGFGQPPLPAREHWHARAWRRCAARRRPHGSNSGRAARSAPRWRMSRAFRTCSRVISITQTPSCRAPRNWRDAQGNMPFVSLILAERCVVATERNDWPAADSLARRRPAHSGRRRIRRLLDERPGLRRCGPLRGTRRRHARCPSTVPPRSTAATAAHLRAAGRCGPDPGRARARLSRFRRSGRRRGRARPGGPHPAAASRPRHAAEDRRSSCRRE